MTDRLNQIATLETLATELQQQEIAHAARLKELDAQITEADKVAVDPFNFIARVKHKESRDRAQAERVDLIAKIDDTRHRLNEARRQILELSREQSRAEYLSQQPDQLTTEAAEVVRQIASVDRELSALDSEAAHLQTIQELAEQGRQAVTSAEGALQAARDALTTAQGEAFIAGVSPDTTKHNARIQRAEGALQDTRRTSEAGVAALPHIERRLAEIAQTRARLTADRPPLVKAYFSIIKRIAEVRYRNHLNAIVDAVRDLQGLDVLTATTTGQELFGSMNFKLRQPVERGTEPLALDHPDLPGIMGKLEAALTAQLEEI